MAQLPTIRRSILGRMLLITLAPAMLLLSALSVYFYAQARASLEDEMSRRLIGMARTLAAQIDPAPVLHFVPGDEQTRTYRAMVEKLRPLAEANDASRVYVVKFDESVLFDTDPAGVVGGTMYQLAGHRRELKLVQQGRAAASPMFKGAGGRFYKAGYAPLAADGETAALVGVDADVRFFERLREIRRNLALLSLFGSTLLAVFSVLFARRLAWPIRRLARSATRIGEGDYETPVAEKTGDEIELLADTLNGMRARIVERDRYLQMMQRGIAHEVRNPLGGMALYCDILSDELAARPDLLAHVEKIRREVKGLDAVVNEFLDFTKEQAPDRRRVDVRDYLAELLMFYAGMAERQGVRVVKTVAADVHFAAFDPDLLRRALHNLLLNALQAMPDGGELRLDARRRPGELEICIADTGKGIPESNLAHVFTPFFTTKDTGTGLGLPFAKKVVESHGGRLILESRIGEGTRVCVNLPQTAETEAS